jgi:serine/threonine protein kinase
VSEAAFERAVTVRRDARPVAKQLQRYVLHEVLGRGGMAVVHRAVDANGRIVALKQLLPQNEFDVDFDLVRSFIEEARLATRFHHVNIARTYSLAKLDQSYVIEMEYVPGPTLLELATRSEVAGALPVSVVIQILIQMCDALEHVHTMCDDAGKPLALVHRDVSMSNIIVSDSGIVKLIDFGIVKGHSSQAPTQAGLIKGKLAYVAPEYLAGNIDSRADLFALGVIAHELLTDRRLFYGKNDLDTLLRLRSLRVAPPSCTRPDVPRELDAIVLTALERDPARRWQSATEMRAALVALQPADARPIAEWAQWALSRQPARFNSQLLRVLDTFDEVVVEVAPDMVLEAAPVPRPGKLPIARGDSRTLLLLSLLTGLGGVAFLLMYVVACALT